MPRQHSSLQQQQRSSMPDELYLVARGLTQAQLAAALSGVAAGHLQELWLDRNHLVSLAGLEGCVRSTALHAAHNAITDCSGLASLKQLTRLDLSNSRLESLEEVVACLRKLPRLSSLCLAGQPCCEQPHYRLRVLAAAPCTLEVLDDQLVTPQERLQAARWRAAEAAAATATSGQGGGGTATGSQQAASLLLMPPRAAFGSHLPPHDRCIQHPASASAGGLGTCGSSRRARGSLHAKQRQLSQTERALAKEAAAIRQHRRDAAAAAEEAWCGGPDLHAAFWAPRDSLPRPASLLPLRQEDEGPPGWTASTTGAHTGSISSTSSSATTPTGAGGQQARAACCLMLRARGWLLPASCPARFGTPERSAMRL